MKALSLLAQGFGAGHPVKGQLGESCLLSPHCAHGDGCKRVPAAESGDGFAPVPSLRAHGLRVQTAAPAWSPAKPLCPSGPARIPPLSYDWGAARLGCV